MANIYKSAIELVGGTPLMEAVHLEEKLGLQAKLRDLCKIFKVL